MRSSEGYVARSLLARLDPAARVVLVTRKNNVAELRANPEFRAKCPNVHLVGYDLPKWAAWWKMGARLYGPYAYLWQAIWPFVLRKRPWLVSRLSVVHTFNFHNDSIPSTAWILGRPTVWGPINHNEGIAEWRSETWPTVMSWRNRAKTLMRRLAWRLDPLLTLATRRTSVVLSAGSWVDRRLRLTSHASVRRRSQLGLDLDIVPQRNPRPAGGLRLVSGGRLDWIKGLDLALLALAQLPDEATLTLIGDGPCRAFLADFARAAGVANRVTFHPAVPRDELLAMYGDYDVFLFTSAEAGGLSWVEALATGLPVIGFEGPSELSDMACTLPGLHRVTDQHARANNVTALAEAILAVSVAGSNPAEIAEAARTRYGWDGFAGQVLDVYATLGAAPR
ncbi:glycosyltransferase family 4 protein [Roseovarius sp. S4756]|uniref:glycosyltransferase family 4 protein n=1 Tax=Roseovarius maritimus TaxID=3342637 RepID=UPI00372A0482